MTKSSYRGDHTGPARKIKYLAVYLITMMAITSGLSGDGMKKVLVLPFVNAEKNKNVEYLRDSLTEAVRSKLKKRFAFRSPPEREWQETAENNYLFPDDFATRSVALNLGLLAMQDVVISGEYRVRGDDKLEIRTGVKIIDISRKKVIAEFEETGPADNRIFDTVTRIADRISNEAKAVLPTREEWQRTGSGADSGKPWFADFQAGLRAGGARYALDFSERVQPEQPVIGGEVSAAMPTISPALRLGLESLFFKETPVAGRNPELKDLSVDVTNYAVGSGLAVRFQWGSLSLSPKLGGGIFLQNISVNGDRQSSHQNRLPYGQATLSLGYDLSRNYALTTSLETYFQFGDGSITLLGLGSLGIRFYL